jgi:hypothetical protein
MIAETALPMEEPTDEIVEERLIQLDFPELYNANIPSAFQQLEIKVRKSHMSK